MMDKAPSQHYATPQRDGAEHVKLLDGLSHIETAQFRVAGTLTLHHATTETNR